MITRDPTSKAIILSEPKELQINRSARAIAGRLTRQLDDLTDRVSVLEKIIEMIEGKSKTS